MKKISVLIILLFSVNAFSQEQADAAFYKNEISQWLTKKVGTWDVTMTLQPTADTKPMTVGDLEAERTMIGAFCLHEVMKPKRDAKMPLFTRLSDLDYNFNEARWDYISIDTRITGGIMYFTNGESSPKENIVSHILNFPHPGFGPQQTNRGKTVKMRNVITTINKDHETVKQYWKMVDGEEWLGTIYDYKRRK